MLMVDVGKTTGHLAENTSKMKSSLQVNIIVAMCEGGGIGRDGTLPWRLKSELANFSKLTKAVSTEGR